MMRAIVSVFAGFFVSLSAAGADFDQRMLYAATPYLPLLSSAYEDAWPDSPMRSAAAAQAEKESRWNPRAELCVPKPTCSRERGIGLGQFTITPRFNVFVELSSRHPKLRGWKPEEYMDPAKQLLALVVKDRGHHRQCSPLFKAVDEVMACVASAYNGGFGGVLADRRLCSNTKGCDPTRWFAHVAEYSTKAKAPMAGYGQSFYQINRSYAHGVVKEWRHKYVPALGS